MSFPSAQVVNPECFAISPIRNGQHYGSSNVHKV